MNHHWRNWCSKRMPSSPHDNLACVVFSFPFAVSWITNAYFLYTAKFSVRYIYARVPFLLPLKSWNNPLHTSDFISYKVFALILLLRSPVSCMFSPTLIFPPYDDVGVRKVLVSAPYNVMMLTRGTLTVEVAVFIVASFVRKVIWKKW